MAFNKLSELAGVMNEAAREGKILGFDEVSGDIRSYDTSQIQASVDIEGESVTATTTGITRTVAEWMAEITVVEDIATLRNTEGNRNDQLAWVTGYYSDTAGVGGGLFYWNAFSTRPDDGGMYFQVSGVTTGRWFRIPEDPMVLRSEYYGLFNGVESDPGNGAIIDDMINETPDGGTVKFYNVSPNVLRMEEVNVSNQTVTIDFNGNFVAGVDNQQVLSLQGEVTDSSAVSLVEEVPFSNLGFDETGQQTLTRLTVADASAFSEGDVVKVIASDLIPDLFNPGRTLGEFAVVAQSDATTITLYTKLYDHDLYQNDVYVGKLADHAVDLYNVTFVNDDAGDQQAAWGLQRVNMELLKHNHVENVHGINIDTRLVSMYSCYQYVMKECHVNNSGNFPVGDGYVLNDSGGHGGYAYNLSSDHCRHVVTTNSRAPSGVEDYNSGRGMHLTVVGGVGKSSGNHAFDTHPEAVYTTFIGCKAYQCEAGFQARSPHTTFDNCIAFECTESFTLGTARENFNNSFRYATITNCKAINSRDNFTYYGGFLNIGGDFLSTNDYGPVYVKNNVIEFTNTDNSGGNILVDGNVPNLELYFENNTVRYDDIVSSRLIKLIISERAKAIIQGNTFYGVTSGAVDFRVLQMTGTWPGAGDPKPMTYFLNNSMIGPTEIDALVAESDVLLGGNIVETTGVDFSAHKFDGTVMTAGYTD